MAVELGTSSETIEIHRTSRGEMVHFAHDACIGLSLKRYGEWAEDEINLLKNYICEGDTVLDVGANVGTHAIAFSEHVGPLGRVVAIEAARDAYSLLCRNILANINHSRITPLNVLAGEECRLVEVALENKSRENIGARHFRDEVGGLHRQSFFWKLLERLAWRATTDNPLRASACQAMITIDSMNLPLLRLIKIDVEGMEEEVLRGAKDTLTKLKPVVYFEFATGNIEFIIRIHALLTVHEYNLYWHFANPFNSNNFNGDRENIFGGNVEINVLAVHRNARQPASLMQIFDPTVPPSPPDLQSAIKGVSIP